MANPEIPAGIVQIKGCVNGADGILGSGMVIAARHVLTARHVIIRKDPSGRVHEASGLHVRVANHEVPVRQFVEPTGEHTDHLGDVALLILESDLPSTQIVTVLRDAQWYLSRWQQRNAQVTFYGWPLDEALPQAHPCRVLGGMVRLSEPDALTDLQVPGGVLKGFSGGPVMLRVDRKDFVIGLARLGGVQSASSRLIGSDQFLGFLSEHGVHAQTVSAKDIYSVVGWLPIADPIATLKQEKIAELLTWTARLTKLVGRPLQPFIDWAENALGQDKVCCKVIAGEGGLGKTRYAFEGADQLSKAGWQVALIRCKQDLALFHQHLADAPDPLDNRGLVVIDYAEALRGQLGELLTSIQKSAQRIAVVLLSRHGEDYWRQTDRLPNASLCELTVEPFNPLLPEHSFQMLQNVLTSLEVNLDVVPRQAYLDWLDPLSHPDAARKRRDFLRYPLLILGAGLCLKLDASARFEDLTHRGVIESLVEREMARFTALEQAAGFAPSSQGLSLHLQLLAIMSNALDSDMLQHLGSDPSLAIGFDGPHTWEAQLDERGVDCLYQGAIKPLTPDLFAAGFAYEILEKLNRKHPQRVPRWLAAIADHLDNLDGFLEQFALRWHDLWTLGYGNANDTLSLAQIEQWLVALFQYHLSRCRKAQNYFSDSTCLMPRVGVVVWAPIVAELEESAQQNYAAYAPDLAMSLNNWSNRLAESGERPAALAAIQRAVEIYKKLAEQNYAAYAPDLAMSLNNWSLHLAESGERPAALAAIQRAVEIRKALRAAD